MPVQKSSRGSRSVSRSSGRSTSRSTGRMGSRSTSRSSNNTRSSFSRGGNKAKGAFSAKQTGQPAKGSLQRSVGNAACPPKGGIAQVSQGAPKGIEGANTNLFDQGQVNCGPGQAVAQNPATCGPGQTVAQNPATCGPGQALAQEPSSCPPGAQAPASSCGSPAPAQGGECGAPAQGGECAPGEGGGSFLDTVKEIIGQLGDVINGGQAGEVPAEGGEDPVGQLLAQLGLEGMIPPEKFQEMLQSNPEGLKQEIAALMTQQGRGDQVPQALQAIDAITQQAAPQ